MIDGPGCTVGDKTYKINEPPTERPVRIYADGEFPLLPFFLYLAEGAHLGLGIYG